MLFLYLSDLHSLIYCVCVCVILHVPAFKNKQKSTRTRERFPEVLQQNLFSVVLLMQDECESDCRMGTSIFLKEINLVSKLNQTELQQVLQN